MNDYLFFLILLLWSCAIFLLSVVILGLQLWLLVASIIDLSAKKEDEFTNKNAWIALLIASIFFPFGIVIPIVYFFKYKPSLKFWRR